MNFETKNVRNRTVALSVEQMKTNLYVRYRITVALIQSRLDYANSVCYGISAGNLAKLQCM